MTRYRIDPGRSRVVIDARSSVHPIHTEVTGLTGWIDVAPESAGGSVELAVDRLRSGNPLEDAELRRRIDARRFPTITGTVSALEEMADDRWRVEGDVTFRGVTKRCEGDVTIETVAGGLHLTGMSVFDIRDFGMAPPRILMLRVFPDVKVGIDVTAVADD
jgi:polyisoprenoid-binding protein YceI